ncbi:MAG: transcription elongation factor GreA [Nocardioidaceae bacterium]|nr:transcription elongation factor GreA [Nocardioidaceae bacterium]MCL2612010.1 transcription elongation factor GreA [Nocardioidaceae bacterium]
MTQTDQGKVWLTQDAYEKLKSELEHLKGPRRAEIVAEISAARDEGDLKENGGYHAAREEQGKNEARITQLEQMLEKAEIGETPADDGVVEPGMVVTYKFEGDDDEDAESFLLLGSREGAPSDVTVYTPEAPLGAAINGRNKGETVSFTGPTGKDLSVVILDAKPYKA